MVFFDQSQSWICMKQTKTQHVRHVRVIRVHIRIYLTHIYPGMMYDTIKYYGSVAPCSGNTSIDSVYFCPCARTRYILYRTYFATTKSNSSSSA